MCVSFHCVNRGGSGVAGGRLQKKKLRPPINRGAVRVVFMVIM